MNERGKRARCCDGNFLLAETEVVMTTLISLKRVSSLDTKFSSLEIFWYFIGIYKINKHYFQDKVHS